ncbi:uncharacterized protein TRAVEDRAFT_83518, partial [Trametes versicolor FP-101664 SS1]|uniref:uncharacterized protein n=1 Tax=Trametes versicolor (strain FP-101664) TaxID=717944 RepID=UPI000462455A
QATTRCRECRGKEPMCTAWAVRGHRNLPFHWLDVWNGSYFDRHDLSDYGYELFLGHNGSPCPNIDYRDNATRLVVVHDNGIHNCQLRYCFCGGGMMKLSQLIRADLFPASLARIETAFTCEVLERFHLDYDISKRSSQDFVRVLSQLSARDAITGEVKDRYRGFMFAARIYRYLTMVKRSGRKHGVVVPGRRAEDITVPCFTCPIPNFNLPDGWKDTPEELRYLYRIIFCADGNYSLQKKTKQGDPNDIALSTGQGFFIPHSKMYADLDKKERERDTGGSQPITCDAFKVVRSQRTGKFKHVDVSGVLSYSCDHMHFRPGATVDLQTTETWVHGDFGLNGALDGTEEL